MAAVAGALPDSSAAAHARCSHRLTATTMISPGAQHAAFMDRNLPECRHRFHGESIWSNQTARVTQMVAHTPAPTRAPTTTLARQVELLVEANNGVHSALIPLHVGDGRGTLQNTRAPKFSDMVSTGT
ncbi:uncharacterized protein [Dermacentor albipictus]|uniref:uncharacterized protein n=1 Tax=Dermacentor albipictus TaxID=60249 RepID=UPI0038FCE7A5